MVENLVETTERNYRVNFKQTSKGYWYGEFSTRGDSIGEVRDRIQELKNEVLLQLDALNGKMPSTDFHKQKDEVDLNEKDL